MKVELIRYPKEYAGDYCLFELHKEKCQEGDEYYGTIKVATVRRDTFSNEWRFNIKEAVKRAYTALFPKAHKMDMQLWYANDMGVLQLVARIPKFDSTEGTEIKFN